MRKYFFITVLLLTCHLLAQSQPINNYNRLGIDSLKKVLPSLHDTARINCLNTLAAAYFGLSDPLKARADSASLYAMQANKEAIRIGYKYGLAKSLLNLGRAEHFRIIIKMRSGITDSTGLKTEEQFLSQAIVLGEELRNNKILAEAYSSKAGLFLMGRNIPGQIENMKKSIYYSQQAGDEESEGEVSLWLSEIYSQRGDYEKSFEYGQNALKLNKKINSTAHDLIGKGYRYYLVQESLTNLSSLYSEAGDHETAMTYLRESRQFAKAYNTYWEMDAEMGDLFRKMGQYDSSFYYLLRWTKVTPTNLWVKTSLGETYLSTNQYDKALDLFHDVIDSLRRRNHIVGTGIGFHLGRALIGAARVYLAKKDYKTALRYAKEGAGLLELNKPDVMNNSELLSDIYHHLGKNDSAYSYLKKYITLKDSILNRQFLMRLNNYKSQVESDKKESQLALLNKDNKIKEQQLKQGATFKKFLIAFFIAIIFAGLYIFRNLTLKRKNEKLQREQMEQEWKMKHLESEKKQAELQRQTAELEMQALRAQMNPHFIFNCLSSINRFILKNETEAASDYLTRFSRLIRMVLINSQKSLITLEDELEMLRLYLDMERLRFKNSFDYNINFKNTIDAGAIFIPPLLLQPFCENAIWHGLMHKEGHGVLDIAMTMQDNILNCTITDNGIGREKATELKSKSAEKDKSLGLKITTERLALLNKDNGAQTFYEIEDLYDEKGDASGTKVKLQIRYKESVEELI